MDVRTKQVEIPAQSVTASLRDVQAAAAQLTSPGGAPHGAYGATSAENTGAGVRVRGPWWEPAVGVAGAWTATYVVKEAESGKSTLSGTFAVALDGDYSRADLRRHKLEATAIRHTAIFIIAAEGIARQRSAGLGRSPATGPSRSRTEPGNSVPAFPEDRAAWIRSAESRARRLGAEGLER